MTVLTVKEKKVVKEKKPSEEAATTSRQTEWRPPVSGFPAAAPRPTAGSFPLPSAARPTSGQKRKLKRGSPPPPKRNSPDRGNSGSDDELQHKAVRDQLEVGAEEEANFARQLAEKGFVIKRMGEDGSCLFRAVSHQLYGDENMQDCVRKQVMDYIAANPDHFSSFISEDFTEYVNRKRLPGTFGNNVEIQAICELYNRPVEIYQNSSEPINTFQSTKDTPEPPIRLSYHQGCHYNSVVDPYAATIGVGLGLPEYKPGIADKQILDEATRKSMDEQRGIENAMFEDKLKETDWQRTQEAIEEQVRHQSYLAYLAEQGISVGAASASQSTEVPSPRAAHEVSPSHSSGAESATKTPPVSPIHCKEAISVALPCLTDKAEAKDNRLADIPSTSTTGAPVSEAAPSTSAMSAPASAPTLEPAAPAGTAAGIGWEDFTADDEMLAQIMAQSEQEYFNSFKKHS